jgi:hypothetical protein
MTMGGLNRSGRLLLLLGLVVVSACKRLEQTPSGVLQQEQMVHALIELYVSEEKVKRLSLGYDSSLVVFDSLQERLVHKLGTTDSVFKKSLDYYIEHPKQLEKIYAAVVDSLNLREQRAPSLQEQ